MITAGIGFDDACIDRKVLSTDKPCIHAGTDHRLEYLAQDVAIAKPADTVESALDRYVTRRKPRVKWVQSEFFRRVRL